MYIISQNKLVLLREFHCVLVETAFSQGYAIVAYTSTLDDEGVLLGHYETVERCIEVLKDIGNSTCLNHGCGYQMPER
jgi:hypothetical protein